MLLERMQVTKVGFTFHLRPKHIALKAQALVFQITFFVTTRRGYRFVCRRKQKKQKY